MGRRVKAPVKSAPADQVGADDLQVLHPERSLSIAGREITVREYGFVEGLGLRPLIQPFLDDLYALVNGRKGLPPLEEILGVLGKHSDLVAQLMAIAADVDPEWIHQLPSQQGNTLLYAWWTVNGPFFVGAVVDRIRGELAAEAQRKALAGPTSTQPSSSEGMEPQPPSVE
ncbi:hypothetical protein PKB_0782 [Pseudomonas knackmussii B13]|uniref:Tail assembly chaperone n=1 Tax=Pseudomonas knackmussii (strain DSM 6978 / CCUG 54928 / LMG 23759 / B13) TaxID=1301098 RepID=A0A024HAS1_PSEKB|nr:DUF6631 family protein [Pseudomonas knackmussii]CDF82150.1 hypothetical protein PKB_0782 [Pseudomonas knackmussii B13]